MADNPRHNPKAAKPDPPDESPLLPEESEQASEPASTPAPAAPVMKPPPRARAVPTPPDDEADKALAEARKLLNRPSKPDFLRPPNSKQIEEAKRKRFGKGPGRVRLDIDPSTGHTRLVFFDAQGNPLDD